jgi:hypothetical protein
MLVTSAPFLMESISVYLACPAFNLFESDDGVIEGQ